MVLSVVTAAMLAGLATAPPAAASTSPAKDTAVAGDPSYYGAHLRNVNANRMCLGIRGSSTANGAPVIQWDCIRTESDQMWDILHVGGDYFRLKNVHSNRCLGIPGGSVQHGVQAVQWDCIAGERDQLWKITANGAGQIQVRNLNSDMCLGIRGSSQQHGAAAIQWDCLPNETDQRWTIE